MLLREPHKIFKKKFISNTHRDGNIRLRIMQNFTPNDKLHHNRNLEGQIILLRT